MFVKLNGKRTGIADESCVLELLVSMDFDPEKVVISLNGQLIPVEKLLDTLLREGDEVELFSFVSGG